MDEFEKLMRDLPPDVLASVDAAADGGGRTRRDIVRDALVEWSSNHGGRENALAALKADIDDGLKDLRAGRVHPFDVHSIAERGRMLLAGRSTSK